MSNLPLFDPPPAVTTTVDVDGAARAFAVDPRHNVVLEASAGHRQDHRAGAPLREPSQGRRRAVEHPRHHLHAQGRDRDAGADRPRTADGGGALGVRQGALGRVARSHLGDRDQHHRRVLPVAAPRVPARGGPGSRFRHGGRNRSATLHRRVARPLAADLRRDGERGSGHRAGHRAVGCVADAGGAGVAARSPPGGVGSARPLSDARSEGLEG